MQVQLAGEMPSLPAQNSTLRASLMTNKAYLDRLMEVSDRLGAWINAAQAAGDLNPRCRPRWCSTRCSRAPATRCSAC